MFFSKHRTAHSSAFFIALIYIIISVIWITVSDRIAGLFADTVSLYMILQTFKGWLFVIISGVLIYALVRHRMNIIFKSAAELKQTNRILEVLSYCNQILVHAEDEKKFLDDICEIIISNGGYHSVLVAFARPDDSHRLYPVRWKGIGEKEAEDILALPNKDSHQDNPLISVLTTGKLSIANNLTEKATESLFYKMIYGKGVRSMIVLPLVSDNSVFGAAAIFAAESDAFDDSEIHLIEELGGDLSYGIHSLRANSSRLAALRALGESEEKHRTLFETMAQGVVYQDANGEIHSANPAALNILGLNEEQIKRKTSYDKNWKAIHEDGTEFPGEEHPAIVALKTGKEVRNVIMGVYNPYKKMYRWLLINATPLFKQNSTTPYQVYTTFDDITDMKFLQREMDRLSGELNAIIDAAPLAIFDLDTGSNVRSLWNSAAERMFGWKREEVIGRRLPIVPESREQEFQSLHERLMSGESFTGIELHRIRKDGSPIDISSATAPLRNMQGDIIGIMVIASDITEHNKLKQQFLHAQKMEAVGRLAGGMAHDFNNLLTVILGNISMILMNFDENDSRFIMLDEINKTAQRATLLTRQLLTFSRKQVVEAQSINLNTVLKDMKNLLQRLIGEDIELSVKFSDDVGTISIDVGQLEQVITNLVVNSRDAMPKGGKITIETMLTELAETDDYGRYTGEKDDYAMIAVSDTGVGMDRETMEHIFEPFFTTKEQGKGTGLGLTTSYGIVKQNNGHIRIYSEPGHGTTVKVFLPLSEGGQEPVTRAVVEEGDVSGTETILVVEDEPSVRNVAVQILGQLGYTMIEASNGEEGLAMAKAYGLDRIDLLLTDMVMPKMGGKDLADTVHRLRPEVKTLFMSGYTGSAIVAEDIMRIGAYFLQKPFTSSILAKKVRDVLDS